MWGFCTLQSVGIPFPVANHYRLSPPLTASSRPLPTILGVLWTAQRQCTRIGYVRLHYELACQRFSSGVSECVKGLEWA
jgi:hypothetical protein